MPRRAPVIQDVTENSSVPYLELRNLTAWLGPRRVFEGLNLRLKLGEHCVVLGPNGAGKSALIQLLTRELYPVVMPGSSLHIFGSETVNLWALRRRIGVVSTSLQNRYQSSVRTRDVVLSGWFGSVGLGRAQVASSEQLDRVQQLLTEFELQPLADRPFAELSDGQQRRVLLARALVHQPELLVLDEPSNGLDLRARQQLLQSLRRLARSGTTLLLVTHQIEAIIPEIDRAILLRDGRVVGDGPAQELLQSEPLSRLFGTPLRLVEHQGWRQLLPDQDNDRITA